MRKKLTLAIAPLRHVNFFAIFVYLIAILALATPSWAADKAKADAKEENIYQLLELFSEAFQTVRSEYVTPVSDKKILEDAIRGMLGGLDPHSSYLNADEFADLRTDSKGEFGGLGIEVTLDEASAVVRIVSPIDDTPASRAGLQSGDLITKLDGVSIQGTSLNNAVDKMRGKVGQAITLTIQRKGQEAFDVKLVREVIQIRSVKSRREGNIGYLRITSFNSQAHSGLLSEISKLKKDIGEANVLGYVLDLRNNPGGLLEQAVSVSDDFLDKGEIVSTRGRSNSDIQRFQASSGDVINGKPLVVLVNAGSASASEIVAGALQDQKRALIVGVTSFGKGSVQTLIPLSHSEAALKLTTQRYFTPSGKSIQGTGIVPDIYVPIEKAQVVTPSRETHEKDLPGALANPNDIPPKSKESSNDGTNSLDKNTNDKDQKNNNKNNDNDPSPDQADKRNSDNQLQQALDLIRALALFQNNANAPKY